MAKDYSRLSEIFEYQKRQGKGTIGALGSTLGGRTLEKLDIRNLLFGSSRAPAKSLAAQLGRSIFGAGYSATSTGKRRPSEFGTDTSTSLLAGAKVEKILSSIDTNMASMNSKMTILSKNTIQQNRMARDINVIRQNVVLLTKDKLGKARTKADMYFMRSSQREKEYERNLAKGVEAPIATEDGKISETSESKDTTSSFSKFAKIALGVGAIYGVLNGLEVIINGFTSIKDYVLNLANKIINFDYSSWLNSLTPEQISEWGTRIFDSLLNGFTATREFIMNAINSIDDAKIGDGIMFIVNSFLDMMAFIGKTLMRGIETLETDELLKLAAAGGLYALLFGGGGRRKGGLIGTLITSIFSGLARALPALLGVLMTPGGLLAMGIAGLFYAMKTYFDGEVGGEAGAKRLGDQQKTLDAEKARTLSVEDWGKYVESVAPEIRKDAETLERRKSLLSMRQLGESAQKKKNPELNADLAAQINRQKFEGAMSPTAMERTRIAENRKKANAVAGGGGWRPPARTSTGATTTPQKVEETSPATQSNVLRVQSLPSGLPSGFDYDTYTKRVGQMESGNDYGIVNTIGYAGRYQFGAQALETLGYMKSGSSKGGNKAMRDPSNWNNGLSLEKFLASPEIQDEAMKKLTAMNYKQLVSKGIVNPNMSSNELSGWLYVSHGVGVGGAMKFAAGGNPAEGYGTTASQMFAKASGMTHPGDSATGFKMSPFTGGMPQLASSGPSVTGGMFGAPNNQFGELGDTIVNVINNTMQKAEQATNEALSSIDMDSVKDMFNPMIARATYGFTI